MRINGTGEPSSNRMKLCLLAGLAMFVAPYPSAAQASAAYTISTIVGTGTAGFAGDGGPAVSAQINNPCALALDGSGNLYIGDELNYRIRKATTDGNISTAAGNGTAGDTGATGAGGAATSAEIRVACGMVLDKSGNLIFSDTTNHEVKKISTSGTITIIAGNGTGGYAGDLAAATQAELNNPLGLAIDAAGNLYIADSGNHVIRILTTDGNINTFAGNGNPGYGGDGGPSGPAQLSNPTGLAMDAAGNLYVADSDNGVIRKITPGGTVISTFAGNGFNSYGGDGGPATQAALDHPRSVAVDAAGNLYIADTLNSRIRVVTPDGKINTIAGTGTLGSAGDGGPALQAQLFFPTAVTLNAAGNIYIADTQNSMVRLLTPGVAPGAAPTINNIISATEFGAFPDVAPGSWIEVHGTNLASETRLWTAADFSGLNAPVSLDHVAVTIAGQNAFVYAISPNQVNVQVPSNVGPGPQPVVVTTPGGTSNSLPLTIKTTQPGLYAPTTLLAAGNQYTAEFNDATETFVMPAGAVSGLNSRPAHAGDVIVLWGTGFGAVSPNIFAGQVVQQYNSLMTPVQFSVGGIPATTLYAGLAPDEIGLYQFDLLVPNVAPGSAVPVTFNQGGVAGAQTLYIAVE